MMNCLEPVKSIRKFLNQTHRRREEVMAITGAIMVPHPPIILSEVGRGEEKKIKATVKCKN